jgi:hypothetical protein
MKDDLKELAEATAALRAPGRLRDRVLADIRVPRPLFAVAVVWAARAGVGLGALAAAAAALLAVHAERAFTASLAAAALGLSP